MPFLIQLAGIEELKVDGEIRKSVDTFCKKFLSSTRAVQPGRASGLALTDAAQIAAERVFEMLGELPKLVLPAEVIKTLSVEAQKPFDMTVFSIAKGAETAATEREKLGHLRIQLKGTRSLVMSSGEALREYMEKAGVTGPV